MAPRKKPGMILKRDHAFTEAIGKPTSRKPNAFSMAADDFKEKLETARTAEPAESLEVQTDTAEPEPAEGVAHAEGRDDAGRPDTRAAEADTNPPLTPELPDTGGTKTQAAPDRKDDEASKGQAEAERKGSGAGTAERVEMIVSITVPKDLVERAERWGAIARQPAPTVLRHALKKMKPQLLTELKTIRVGDVHQDRIEKVGYRLQSRLRFTPTEFADMQARLDPAGFGILSSMLNHYARDSFADFLDTLMADAGY